MVGTASRLPHTFGSDKGQLHPTLCKVQALTLDLLDQSLCGLGDGCARSDVQSPVRLSSVMLLVRKAILLLALVETEEDELRVVEGRVVFLNEVLLGLGVGITDDGLDVFERGVRKSVGGLDERVEVIE